MPEDKQKRNARQQRWQNEQDRINFVMPKGYKDKIKDYASARGISAAQWIREAIESKMQEES